MNFYQLVHEVMKIEKSEMKSQERKSKRKFSKGSSSSGKRTRESKVESVHGSATRGRRQGPAITLGSNKGISTGQKERIECPHYHKHHPGTCRRISGGCFQCGSTRPPYSELSARIWEF